MSILSPIGIVIPRDDVEQSDIGPVLQQLRRVYSDTKNIRRNQGKLDLSVHGYGSDDRELYEISEVCEYVKLLSLEFPYWFYFLDLERPTLGAFSSCVSNAKRVVDKDGITYFSVDSEVLASFMFAQFTGLNKLFHEHDLDRKFPSFNRTISERVTEYYETLQRMWQNYVSESTFEN